MVTKGALWFLFGFLSCAVIFYFSFVSANLEVPFVTNSNSSGLKAPEDFISEGDIMVFEDYVLIKVSNASLSRYAPTGSMKPVFDAGANGIRVVPKDENSIHLGDIISFRSGEYLIVHRVIEIGNDDDGKYFVTKGDNNLFDDGKVRFEDIEYVTIGVIW